MILFFYLMMVALSVFIAVWSVGRYVLGDKPMYLFYAVLGFVGFFSFLILIDHKEQNDREPNVCDITTSNDEIHFSCDTSDESLKIISMMLQMSPEQYERICTVNTKIEDSLEITCKG